MSKEADQQRLDSIHKIPCVCCYSLRIKQPSPTEANHVVDNGYRRLSGGHQATNALCGWHHRAELPTWWTEGKREMLAIYGPSMKYQGGKGEFERVFGTQRELIQLTDKLLDSISGNL